MELHLKGKTVVITGGGSGIGKAVAYEYLKEGCNVAICGRTQSRLDSTYDEFKLEGYEIFTKSVDVTDYNALSAFADEVETTFGKIDIWYNNAGSNKSKALMNYHLEEFNEMTDILFASVFSGCKIAALHMKKNGGGVILNASSFSALAPNAGRGVYSACKAGVVSLSQVFAAELAPDNIRVLSYIPGLIATEIVQKNIEENGERLLRDIPMRRFGTPEDLSKVLVFVSSDAASYVNGVHIDISGGKRCVQNPWYAWEK